MKTKIYIVTHQTACNHLATTQNGANAFFSERRAQQVADNLNKRWRNRLYNAMNGGRFGVKLLTIYEET